MAEKKKEPLDTVLLSIKHGIIYIVHSFQNFMNIFLGRIFRPLRAYRLLSKFDSRNLLKVSHPLVYITAHLFLAGLVQNLDDLESYSSLEVVELWHEELETPTVEERHLCSQQHSHVSRGVQSHLLDREGGRDKKRWEGKKRWPKHLCLGWSTTCKMWCAKCEYVAV